MTDKAAREMTFEEEAKLYKEETAEFLKSETVDSEPPFVNSILRRGNRIIRKASAEIERLQSENTRLKAEVNQYKEFKNYFDSLYGQGLEVANWHLNGSLEPFDNFFDSAVDEMECGRKLEG